MTVDHMILYACPHPLPVDCRKSRNNRFSIRNRSNSLRSLCSVGWPSLRGPPLGRWLFPWDSSLCLRLYRVIHRSICFNSNPKCSAISHRVLPAARSAISSGSITAIFVYFLFSIAIPPDVVIFSYIRGPFVYCLLLLERFSIGTPLFTVMLFFRQKFFQTV